MGSRPVPKKQVIAKILIYRPAGHKIYGLQNKREKIGSLKRGGEQVQLVLTAASKTDSVKLY